MKQPVNSLLFFIFLFSYNLEASISTQDRSIQVLPSGYMEGKHKILSEAKITDPNSASEFFDVPVTYNKQVQYWVNFFQTRARKSFSTWLERSYTHLPQIQKKLEEAGLPKDLAYIAMIESGFSFHAVSSAQAVGPWQFIASTGKRFGLKINTWIDERRDLDKSTDAAIAYMKILYSEFNSWYLVAAAYNTGEGRVRRYIKKYGTKDFWVLSKNKAFVEETSNYIPKFLAAVLISKAPQIYGFRNLVRLPAIETEMYSAPGGTRLNLLAQRLGISHRAIKDLNPELSTGTIPQHIKAHSIRLPKGASKFLAEADIKELSKLSKNP